MGALMFTCTISLHLFLIYSLNVCTLNGVQLQAATVRASAWPPHRFEVDGVLLPYWSGYAAPSNVNGSFTAINVHKLHQHVCLLLSVFKSSHFYGNIEEMAIGSH